MVTNTTIYTRQLYVSLSTDVPDVDFKNGDEVYLIDTRQRIIYDEENSTWYPLPSGGGGGGADGLALLASGTYTKAGGTNLAAIPVSYNGTAVAVLVEVDAVTPGMAQSIAWARCFSSVLPGWTDPNDWMHGGPGGNIVKVQYANDTLSALTGNISYVYFSADNTTLTAARYNSAFPVLDGTYNWYIWGIPT